MERTFVFYDPAGRRWVRFRRIVGVLGTAAVALIVLLVLALLSTPLLPKLGLPAVQHLADFGELPSIIRGEKSIKAMPFHPHAINYVRNGGNPVLHPKTAAKTHEDQPLVFGYYVNWDPASLVSLRFNLNRLTHLIPEWMTLQNGKADLADETNPTVVNIAQDANLPILVQFNNFRYACPPAHLPPPLTPQHAHA